MSLRGITATFVASVSTLMFSAGAAAQEPGVEASNADEIVVTARFREELIQEIGASIAALDGDELQRSGIVDFEDLSNRMAGVELLDRGPNSNEINIRGVTNSIQVSGNALQPLVSILVDDISMASSSASQRDFNFFDFDRVEVLRGPQPTYLRRRRDGRRDPLFLGRPGSRQRQDRRRNMERRRQCHARRRRQLSRRKRHQPDPRSRTSWASGSSVSIARTMAISTISASTKAT